ncbi:hypothetical protein GCM10009117_18070 [Gangjinia marincola]|uniref:Phenylalanyl-tRNA synthetase subunit alpha n=1 Tax=Gangjinia marincola TaxID=578463 RepID=A0ABP3XTC9_9FLAO
MKKDITIPKTEGVLLAAVFEKHAEYHTDDWNIYILNTKPEPLENLLIVSKGFSATKVTPAMRHKLAVLPAKSYAKVEFLQQDVLALTNEFSVTFFHEGTLYDQKFVFKPNAIKASALKEISLMDRKGVLGLVE